MTQFSSTSGGSEFAEIASKLPDATALDSGDKIALLTNDIGAENWSHSLHSGTVYGVAVSDATGQVISESNDNTVKAVDGITNAKEIIKSDNRLYQLQ